MLIALRLSKAGYGRPDEILQMPTNLVLAALDYEKFTQDYEATFLEINRSTV